MNGRKAKKLRKEIRKSLGEAMNVLNKLTRQRPRFIPKSVWVLLFLPLFSFKNLKVIYRYLK